MRKATIGILVLLGLLLGMAFVPFSQAAPGMDESADKSMITTESGNDEYFLDSGDMKFVIDMIYDQERSTEVKVFVVNPDVDPRDMRILMMVDDDQSDWSFKFIEILDEDGDNLIGDDDTTEIEKEKEYLIAGVGGGKQLTVIIEARYKGEDKDASTPISVQVTVGGMTASKTLDFHVTEGNYLFIWLSLAFAGVGLLYAFILARTVMKRKVDNEDLERISGYIKDGAKAFLNAEYKVIAVFAGAAVLALIIMVFTLGMVWMVVPAFIFGALFSATAGNIGMRVATMANSKTAWACKDSINSGLKVAFNSGAVMGLTVVGLGLTGVTILYALFGNVEMLFGFGFGASSIALFARVGGGIYTKAADVGADLVGKVEAGIPEDDPRNPATIADNVGDNVGDVAGMGADLFESYVDSIIAAMALGIVGISVMRNGDLIHGGSVGWAVILPILLAGMGIISAIIGTLLVGGKGDPHKALNRGIYGASAIMAVATLIVMFLIFKEGNVVFPLFLSVVTGLGAGILIGKATEYYTSDKKAPTRRVAKASETGAATNIISGLALGMWSTIIPVLAVVATIMITYYLADLYGIALAAVGMLSTLGITLATDTYGPVADNAAGLAEMAGLGKNVRKRAEELDAVGNTTAAIGKGFAIGSAGLTALALFSAFTLAAGIDLSSFTLVNPAVVAGLFLGGLLPFVFSALTMQAVGTAAQGMVEEVRRQFREIKGILEGEAEPDYERCVEISTKSALKAMILPSLIAVLAPIIVGSISIVALGGMLAGSIVTGFVLAVMMANSGGAWDNAKKYIEGGALGGKGSDPHKAAVVGDTVGDPFKDTSGPSLNILIKLMSIVSLVFVPLFLLLNSVF